MVDWLIAAGLGVLWDSSLEVCERLEVGEGSRKYLRVNQPILRLQSRQLGGRLPRYRDHANLEQDDSQLQAEYESPRTMPAKWPSRSSTFNSQSPISINIEGRTEYIFCGRRQLSTNIWLARQSQEPALTQPIHPIFPRFFQPYPDSFFYYSREYGSPCHHRYNGFLLRRLGIS